MGFRIKSLAGHSMGGIVVIMQASNDSRVESVIDIAGATDAHSVRKKTVIGEYGEPVMINSFRLVKKINVPKLFVSGRKDRGLDWQEMKKLFDEANDPKELKLLPNADHCFSHHSDRTRMINFCAKWIKNI